MGRVLQAASGQRGAPAAMRETQKKLIIDIGMHKGEDTDFYLRRGYRVVGVEANPLLVKDLSSKFSDAISSGNLIIIDKAVAEKPGTVDFYINDRVSVWGSIDPVFVERNSRNGENASQTVRVPSTTMEEIVNDHPGAIYIKIDVEGMDLPCLRSLSRSPCRPKYISIESSVTCPINNWLEEFHLLQAMGYDNFKFVNQALLHQLNGTTLDIEGGPVVYQHMPESSGPFGDEAPSEWVPINEATQVARKLRRDFEAFSKESNTPRPIVKMRRSLRRLRGLSIPTGWYDLHARRSV